MIAWFNEDKSRDSYNDIVEENGRKYLLFARPFLPVQQSCLKCHGDSDQAPVQLRERYHWTGGWNFKLGDIIAAEFIRSPLQAEFNAATVVTLVFVVVFTIGVILLAFYARLRMLFARSTVDLRKSEDYLTSVIDSMPSMLIGVSPDGRITQWNRKAQQVTGLSLEEVMAKPLGTVIPHLADEIDHVHEAIASRQLLAYSRRFRMVEETIRYEDITIYPLLSYEMEGAVIRVDDVTDQVRLEEMLVQSEKMLSVGGLAAGMAHEINNPLAGIIQNADVLMIRLTDLTTPANQRAAQAAGVGIEPIASYMQDRGIPQILDGIKESGLRAAKIVQNMLSFARKEQGCLARHDLVDILDRSLELAATDYDLKKDYDFKRINIIRQYENDIPSLMCEVSKIQQVIMNILRNGAEAMQEKWIGSDRGDDGSQFNVRLAYEQDDAMVRLEIEDNGPGLDDATRKRIFDPFFTTKPVGRGTGLGLSISYYIITETYGGKMRVESAVGRGTKFIIHLPLEQPVTSSVEEAVLC
jgi:PAS domain S-box-containing protein